MTVGARRRRMRARAAQRTSPRTDHAWASPLTAKRTPSSRTYPSTNPECCGAGLRRRVGHECPKTPRPVRRRAAAAAAAAVAASPPLVSRQRPAATQRPRLPPDASAVATSVCRNARRSFTAVTATSTLLSSTVTTHLAARLRLCKRTSLSLLRRGRPASKISPTWPETLLRVAR